VIEYVEDHHALLIQLNSWLSAGSYLLIGTRDATNIKLNQPDSDHYSNEIYAPYHLYISTLGESLEYLALRQGWKPVEFCDRAFSDTRWLCLKILALRISINAF
jgi:hypothetical protein